MTTFIPYTEKTFGLPYMYLSQVKRDFFDVKSSKTGNEWGVMAHINIGYDTYCFYADTTIDGKTDAEAEKAAIWNLNSVLKKYKEKFEKRPPKRKK